MVLIYFRHCRSFRFSKKFFWFGHESVEPQHLSTYLRSEKQEIAHPNAAYASQTGKGLLFFAKSIEDKAQPAGILNLVSAPAFFRRHESMKMADTILLPAE